MKKLLVILGPTATGKTDVAIYLAKKLNGEIISADSRQVYKGLDIGTGKEPSLNFQANVQKFTDHWEIEGVKVWMYDVADPMTRYTVKDYIDQAGRILARIIHEGKLPIIIGGTGLYIRALTDGLPNLDIPDNPKLRVELEQLTLDQLQQKLQVLSPSRWKNMNNSDRANKRRLLRSIELVNMYPYESIIQNTKAKSQKFITLKIGLTAPREVLNQKIDLRLDRHIDQGLVEEARGLSQQGLSFARMRELGLEYGCLADLLEGKIDLGQFTAKLKTKIHQYAKRQWTWFKKERDVQWFDITDSEYLEKVEKIAVDWYNLANDQKN